MHFLLHKTFLHQFLLTHCYAVCHFTTTIKCQSSNVDQWNIVKMEGRHIYVLALNAASLSPVNMIILCFMVQSLRNGYHVPRWHLINSKEVAHLAHTQKRLSRFPCFWVHSACTLESLNS